MQPPLARLLQTLAGVTVVGRGAPLPAFDCHLPLMSVPHVLRLPSVAADGPYLAAEPERAEHWRHALGTDGFRGRDRLAGQSEGAGPAAARSRCAATLPLSQIPRVRLISLQKNDGAAQLAGLPDGMMIETFGESFDAGADAFLDTAAVIMNLDLVITSDTSIAHLAGALGRPGLDRAAARAGLALDGAGRGDAVVFDRAGVQADACAGDAGTA